MNLTIMKTPMFRTLMPLAGDTVLKFAGWTIENKMPDLPKSVVIGAPHTSNWDLFYLLACTFSQKMDIHWMGKDTIFEPPFGTVCKWLGGIPIDRSKSNNAVDQFVSIFKERETFTLVVAPEGTRGQVSYWRTGFYHIANGAGVPIIPGYLDFGKKRAGFGEPFMPTGNIESDMEKLKTFYSQFQGKNPHLSSTDSIRTKIQ